MAVRPTTLPTLSFQAGTQSPWQRAAHFGSTTSVSAFFSSALSASDTGTTVILALVPIVHSGLPALQR